MDTHAALDLDDCCTWADELKALVIRSLSRMPELDATRLLCLTRSSQTESERLMWDEVFESAISIVRTKYQRVAAFHGCRVHEIDTYSTHGIMKSDAARLFSKARKIFSDVDGVDRVIDDFVESECDYLRHNDGKVFFCFSQFVNHPKLPHYTQGSELLRAIVNRVGGSTSGLHSRLGIPCIFHCHLPIEWIEESTTGNVFEAYVRDLLRGIYAREHPKAGAGYPPDGGFSLQRNIPSEFVAAILDLTGVESLACEWLQGRPFEYLQMSSNAAEGTA